MEVTIDTMVIIRLLYHKYYREGGTLPFLRYLLNHQMKRDWGGGKTTFRGKEQGKVGESFSHSHFSSSPVLRKYFHCLKKYRQ